MIIPSTEKKHITAPALCTGCALCANVCPKNAITMAQSDDGFYIPKVDEDSCINCGLCVTRCIALEKESTRPAKQASVDAYGAWSTNKSNHLNSSSGGIFSTLAMETILNGGAVFGVVWKNNKTAVFHQADTVDNLAAMQGSKYTQAHPGLVYRAIKHELTHGRKVLFAGTPCQVHALKQYLRKEHENLLTLDVLCHGVPSHLILDKYISEAEARTGLALDSILFRDKRLDWNNYCVTRRYKNGKEESTPKANDTYMQLFLSDQALNKSCYSCAYAKFPRQGDITVGDYWGVSTDQHPTWPVQHGISAVLANTDKGKSVLLEARQKGKLELYPVAFQSIYRWQKHTYVSNRIRRDHKRQQLLTLLKSDATLSQCIERYGNYYCKGVICLNKNGLIFRGLKAIKKMLKSALRKLRSQHFFT